MADLMRHPSNLLFFGIPLLYYYINLNSSIICCLSFGEIYLSFGISLLTSFDCISSLRDFFDALVILSAILLPTKSQLLQLFFELLFLKQSLSHLLQIF